MAAERRLRGDLAVWLVVLLELATFGIGFVVFAVMRAREPALFAAGQAGLDAQGGAINTALLIIGSWGFARAAAAGPAGARWGLWVAVASGIGFVLMKLREYGRHAAFDLDHNAFDALYVGLTGFHFLHVIAATVIALLLLALLRRVSTHALETGALVWHLVDLLWLVLFALVYLLR